MGHSKTSHRGLALWVLGKSVANWTKRKKQHVCSSIRNRLPMMLRPYLCSTTLGLHSTTQKTRMFKVVNDNHGTTLDHLRTLFTPLGVNVPADPVLTASLELLVMMRHQRAHQNRRRTKVVKSAKDAQTTVSDCLLLARKLSAEVASSAHEGCEPSRNGHRKTDSFCYGEERAWRSLGSPPDERLGGATSSI